MCKDTAFPVNSVDVKFWLQEILEHTKAPLTLKNLAGRTPVDLANQSDHGDIAQYIESRTIFLPSTAFGNESEDFMEDWTVGHTQVSRL